MKEQIQLLDVVAITEDISSQGLRRGQVGTVVEVYSPDSFEVEFSDDEGRTYALLTLNRKQLMALHYQPAEVA
jgi:hypothetical protein